MVYSYLATCYEIKKERRMDNGFLGNGFQMGNGFHTVLLE